MTELTISGGIIRHRLAGVVRGADRFVREESLRHKVKEPYRGKSQHDDRRLFQGLLNAVAFTHGGHPWPCRLEYRLNG